MFAFKSKVYVEECSKSFKFFFRCDLLLAVVGSVDQVMNYGVFCELVLRTTIIGNFLDLL